VKTQIIQLEPYDDTISIKDKMGWGQTTRILLVWPLRTNLLDRKLDLVLLKRHSAFLGAQLACVTRDNNIRFQANRLGIPTFSSIRKAEKSYWRQPRKRGQKSKKPLPEQIALQDRETTSYNLDELRKKAHPSQPGWLTHLATRIAFFTAGVLGLLAIAALFVPSAKIYILPRSQTQQLNIQVHASPAYEQVDLSGSVPVHWSNVIVEGRGSVLSTGSTQIPKDAASGSVRLINLTEDVITVPAGTIVATEKPDPIRFATTQEATILSGTEGDTVPIIALVPGTTGNISAGSIVAIEGPLGLDLTVSNPNATRGGSTYSAPSPNESDYQSIYNDLFLDLQDTSLNEILASLMPGDVLIDPDPILIEVLEETYDPEEGQPADRVSLTLRLEFQAPVVSQQDLKTLGEAALAANLPSGFSPVPESLTIQQISQPEPKEQGNASWQIQAEWQIQAQLNPAQATRLVLGLPAQQAIQRLDEQLPLEQPAQITLTPSWWPRLPILPFRIDVEQNY
jgi:hypothetical protein